jgi:p-cumate 2,3-dioxygenase subunit beta
VSGPSITRAALEDFLYADAALLDEWQLDAWLTTFAADAQYIVPPLDVPDGDPATTLCLINENLAELTLRVQQLRDGLVLAERPRSRTRRMIGNVRRLDAAAVGLVRVAANFTIHRFRDGQRQDLIGHYDHLLRPTTEGLRFVRRRAVLDLETFAPVGVLTTLL